ncbi:MAG: 1-acyl-sn-glycerol-3-phosphate acyltransferase, partial [Gemmatimonadota bacterium]
LYYLGRKGERIVTPAGVNVDPGPVVDRLRRQRGVHDAVVLERPWGEPGVVCAVLAVEPGADPAVAVRAANERLPDAARVRSWRVWPDPDFPRTRTGKARRAEILAWLEAQAPEVPEELDDGGVHPESAPSTPADAFTALARLVERISSANADNLDRSTRVADVLGSLDRVDLVTRIESTYGIAMGPEAFAGDRSLGDLADELFAGAASDGQGESDSAPIRIKPSVPPSEEHQEEPPADVDEEVAADVRGLGRRLDRVPESHWRHWLLIRITRRAFRTGFLRPMWRSFFSMEVDGLEHLADLEPPYIIAANHLSDLDPGATLFALPERPSSRIATTAMWEYFPRARTGPFLYALGVWGLDLVPLVQTGDWRPTLRIAGRVADRASSMLVFPEGERSPDGRLLPFRRGVGVMAQELHLPIVPCGAAGLLAVFPKGRHWVRGCWFGRAPVATRFGAPLPAPRPDDDPEDVVAELRRRIEALVEEARRAARRF